MTKEERIKKAKENLSICELIENRKYEEHEKAKDETNKTRIYLFKLENDLKEDDLILLNNHKAIVSGFTVTNGMVKVKIKKFKKDRATKQYTDIMYSNEYVVQPNEKLEKI